jgi:hypothetical protein
MLMTTSMSAQELAQQIEQLVEDFIASGRNAATAAVERAFAAAKPERITRSTRRARRRLAPRRTPAEMEALSERLYEAVCAKPGETMGVLAPLVGATPRALQVPATRLRKAGQIRSAGQRQLTRYFPLVKNASKSG